MRQWSLEKRSPNQLSKSRQRINRSSSAGTLRPSLDGFGMSSAASSQLLRNSKTMLRVASANSPTRPTHFGVGMTRSQVRDPM